MAMHTEGDRRTTYTELVFPAKVKSGAAAGLRGILNCKIKPEKWSNAPLLSTKTVLIFLRGACC